MAVHPPTSLSLELTYYTPMNQAKKQCGSHDCEIILQAYEF